MSNVNPLATESGLQKLKNKFTGKSNTANEKDIGCVYTTLAGISDGVNICAEACACCWDVKIPDGYHERCEYIGKRTRTGHTSITEHSNLVFYINFSESFLNDFAKFMTWSKYLNVRFDKMSNGNYAGIIGSTFRGFREIFYNVDDVNNAVYKSIVGSIYQFTPSAIFEDFFGTFLAKDRFLDVEPDPSMMLTIKDIDNSDTDRFRIVGMDSINTLMTNLMKIDPEFTKTLDTHDIINFVSITILFKNMSRTGTHQLVRHRNGITQESQRYVDYSNAKFANPALFKPGKYDTEHKYPVVFGPSGPMHMTLDEIGEAMINIYRILSNPTVVGGNYALLKEDARGFLPSNVECGKLYMTFTYEMLCAFFSLREARGAQAEIRLYATLIANWFRENTVFTTKDATDTYTMPKMLITDPVKIDIDMGVEESEVEMTEEDYINYMNAVENGEGETTE